MKLDVVKTVKVVLTVASIALTIGQGWVSKKETDATLKELVKESTKSK